MGINPQLNLNSGLSLPPCSLGRTEVELQVIPMGKAAPTGWGGSRILLGWACFAQPGFAAA